MVYTYSNIYSSSLSCAEIGLRMVAFIYMRKAELGQKRLQDRDSSLFGSELIASGSKGERGSGSDVQDKENGCFHVVQMTH